MLSLLLWSTTKLFWIFIESLAQSNTWKFVGKNCENKGSFASLESSFERNFRFYLQTTGCSLVKEIWKKSKLKFQQHRLLHQTKFREEKRKTKTETIKMQQWIVFLTKIEEIIKFWRIWKWQEVSSTWKVEVTRNYFYSTSLTFVIKLFFSWKLRFQRNL